MILDSVLSEFLDNLKSFGSIDRIPDESSCKLFWKFVDGDGPQDDLLFFISDKEEFQVCRHLPNQRPSLEIKVDWTTTLALNLICQMNFRLRISSCAYKEVGAAGMSNLIVEESANKKVFASPLEEHVDKFYGSIDSVESQKTARYSFPDIYFSIQDYETCFDNMNLGPDGILIVELFRPTQKDEGYELLKGSYYEKIDSSKVLFQGAISHKLLSSAYRKNIKHFGNLRGSFIMMTGPDGIGEAQLNAVDPADDHLIIEKGLERIKKFIFGSGKSKTLEPTTQKTSHFNCRLTFIRLHWKSVLKLLELKNIIESS